MNFAADLREFIKSEIEKYFSGTLKIKVLSSNAKVPFYAYPTDSGLDLCYSGEDCYLSPGESKLFETGISIELPPNTEAQIRPRSGLAAKNKITVLNTPGTIDNQFRGELKVILINHSKEVLKINSGDRIAQMVICHVLHPAIEIVEDLSDSDRGSNGFGSTGV